MFLNETPLPLAKRRRRRSLHRLAGAIPPSRARVFSYLLFVPQARSPRTSGRPPRRPPALDSLGRREKWRHQAKAKGRPTRHVIILIPKPESYYRRACSCSKMIEALGGRARGATFARPLQTWPAARAKSSRGSGLTGASGSNGSGASARKAE
mgnify:CR=1 FL=1